MGGKVSNQGSLPLPERRMLTDAEAADCLGLPIMVFKRECPVQPVRIGRYVRWDRTALDLWLDGLSKTDFDMTSDDWSRVMDEAEEKLPAKRSRRSAQT